MSCSGGSRYSTNKNRIFILCIIVTIISNCNSKVFINHGQSILANSSGATTTTPPSPTTQSPSPMRDIVIGPCRWVIGRNCPDQDIKFYLYTRRNMMDRQYVHIDETLEKSNLTSSFFNPRYPTKIIIHGYNSDMFLHPLHVMREEYLSKSQYNIIYVDWSILSPGPCYMSAVHNTKHTGACVAQLVERILDTGSSDIHVIGFSLGAQLANYIARNLGSFLLPRVTGLDPAMPLFITASANDKLDPTDAAYVDVLHTNAFVQGKIERCGHVDFYMNGGVMQPGCSSQGSNPFACSHQRAAAYFLESIRSTKGFWGWACSSYISYVFGMCPPTNHLVEAGENVRHSAKGMYLIETNDSEPYALGKWTDLPTLGARQPTSKPTLTLTLPPVTHFNDPLLTQIDQWNKLDSNFNNLQNSPTPFSQDPYGNNWTYFGSDGTNEITNVSKNNDSIEEQDLDESNKTAANENILENSTVKWSEYRRNLTQGFIESSIFKVPRIRRSRYKKIFEIN